MKARLALGALTAALVAVCVAWPAAASARPTANSAGYADPTGDSGNAPDVATLNVSNDDAGVISFKIGIANRTAWGSQDLVQVTLDTDGNATNGHNGWDYGILVTPVGEILFSAATGQ